jgi:CRP-like cAMP-binding protein
MIYEGEVEIYLKPNEDDEEPVLLETLMAGCTIGAYSMLMNESYKFIARAKTTINLLILNAPVMEEARGYIEELEISIFEG